jgi:hypothetical protein
MKVGMWLSAPLLVGPWSSLDLVPNYVVLVVGNLVLVVGNEGGGPHHMQGRQTQGLGVDQRKQH